LTVLWKTWDPSLRSGFRLRAHARRAAQLWTFSQRLDKNQPEGGKLEAFLGWRTAVVQPPKPFGAQRLKPRFISKLNGMTESHAPSLFIA
jgi:hypothetical protein